MKLSDVKRALPDLPSLRFQLPDGTFVPAHFHVTEISALEKRSIDCGGNLRTEESVLFQLWTAQDYDHRLGAQKLTHIIAQSETELSLPDAEIEVEYQDEHTIGKYHLQLQDDHFVLIPQHTRCRAAESCGVSVSKPKIRLSDRTPAAETTRCAPDSGCC